MLRSPIVNINRIAYMPAVTLTSLQGFYKRLANGAACSLLVLLVACSDQPISQQCSSENAVGKFVVIPTGSFVKSNAPVYPEEGKPYTTSVNGFEIQSHEVTNSQFAKFVEQTGYVTDAENSTIEQREDGGSAVFARDLEQDGRWDLVKGVNWRYPDASTNAIADLKFHPVIHISHNDASAYALWAGGRLPTETEWEYAASLGIEDPNNAYSGAFNSQGKPIANTWQGIFPVVDSGEDGYKGTAPVACYPASSIGLYDMIGNVWEWTNSPYAPRRHTIKGGSHLCANNFCKRYRPAARQPMETDFSSNHIGFRIVRDIKDSPKQIPAHEKQ